MGGGNLAVYNRQHRDQSSCNKWNTQFNLHDTYCPLRGNSTEYPIKKFIVIQMI